MILWGEDCLSHLYDGKSSLLGCPHKIYIREKQPEAVAKNQNGAERPSLVERWSVAANRDTQLLHSLAPRLKTIIA